MEMFKLTISEVGRAASRAEVPAEAREPRAVQKRRSPVMVTWLRLRAQVSGHSRFKLAERERTASGHSTCARRTSVDLKDRWRNMPNRDLGIEQDPELAPLQEKQPLLMLH